mgnify:FL=1
MTVKDIIREPLDIHTNFSKDEKDKIVYEMLGI